jgi:hypothetical protein
MPTGVRTDKTLLASYQPLSAGGTFELRSALHSYGHHAGGTATDRETV